MRESGANPETTGRSWAGSPATSLAPPVRLLKVDPFYLGSTWRDWSFARAVRKAVRVTPFDLVQSHERMVGADIYRAGDGVHAAWLERRDRMAGPMTRLGRALNPHHRYLLGVEKQMFADPRLRAVICNSQLVKDEITKRFQFPAERLHVIYNGVDLQRFDPALVRLDRERLRTELGIDRNHAVLLFIGSGFARKGLADALQALAQLRDISLVVIGYDRRARRYRDQAVRLGISERCYFVGAVADPSAWYGLADGLVLPTIYDPFPNVALEALACGLPILVSDACGAREVVIEGDNGYITSVGDVPGLIENMKKWQLQVSDPVRSKRLRDNARSSALPFELGRMSQQLLALYRSLLESGGQ